MPEIVPLVAAADAPGAGDEAMWSEKSPAEILDDLRVGMEAFAEGLDPWNERLRAEEEARLDYLAGVRRIEDPYRRLMLLYNAGLRGDALRAWFERRGW